MASKQGYGPDLRKYMDKRLDIRMNASRRIVGVLRGYDQFMNLVLEDVEEIIPNQDQTKQERIPLGTIMMRGNSVVLWECLDKIN
jgi:small nuclear ribonucleoprotein G